MSRCLHSMRYLFRGLVPFAWLLTWMMHRNHRLMCH